MFKRGFLTPIVQWRTLATTSGPKVASTARESEPPIKIAARIKRKPTDVLKALACTVKEDPTGHAYMFVDDPLFAPSRVFEAQNFALSKELGRKAAKYFASQYPTLFMYDEDEPRLMAFRPIKKPKSESADDEDSLNDRIDRLWVKSAMAVYLNAVSHQRPISTPTLLKLLELLCFYNNDEPNDLPETAVEIWLRKHLNPPPNNPWSDDCLAMKIYDNLPEPKDPRATAAVICGMSKWSAAGKAYELWQLSRELGEESKVKDARVYEALIQYGVERLRAVNAERWDLVLDLFRAMAEDGVKPTLGVFNAAFGVLSKGSRWRRTVENAKQLFQEMLQSGVQPSLATFYYVLRIHDRNPTLGGVITFIISHLEKNSSRYTFSDETDGKFFLETMIVICDQLHDPTLAIRLHGLLKTGDNYLYMTDGTDEARYYSRLLTLLSETEETKIFYEKYYLRIVPRYFTPDTRLLISCLRNIEMCGGYQYLPQVCSDMIIYGHLYRREILWEFLGTTLRAPTYQMTTEMLEKLVQMAKDIYGRIELQYKAVQQLKILEKRREKWKAERLVPPQDADAKKEDVDAESSQGDQSNQRKPKDKIRLEWTSDLLAPLAVMMARGGAPRQAWNLYSRLVPPTEEELAVRKAQSQSDQLDVIIGEVPEKLAAEMVEHFIKEKWFDEIYSSLRILARGKDPELVKTLAEKVKKTIPTNAVQLAKLEKYLNLEVPLKTVERKKDDVEE